MEETPALHSIDGTVDAVIFQNEENGYTVLRLEVGAPEPVTVVGCIPGVAPGEGLTVTGTWGRHASYGEQFKAESVERRVPAGEKAMLEYLSSGILKGVGAATARRLVEEFGADLFTVLEEQPELLTKIKGITRKRALEIGASFRLQMGMRRLLDFLSANGLPLQLGMPLYRRYGAQALEVLRDNPYLLVDEELGVGFSAADQLALRLGMEGDDPQRLEAGLLFELSHNLMNGHTFLPRRKLLWATGALIGLEDAEPLEDALTTLVERGEVVSIVGPSGAGKTTLLQILGTLSRPSSGEIEIDGEAVHALSDRQLSRFRNTKIGFVFQFHHLLPEFTALENVCIPGYIGGRDRREVEKRAAELLEMLGMEHRSSHKPAELSGGEQQRVAIARALINSPAVLLADEPSGNLDTKNREEIHRLFFTLRDTLGQTVVIVTHDGQLAAMSDRKIEMVDGQIVR